MFKIMKKRKTEAQKGSITCPKSHIKKGDSWDFNSTAHIQETAITLILATIRATTSLCVNPNHMFQEV